MTYRLVDSPPAIREAIGMSDHDSGLIRAALSDSLEAAAHHVPDEWVFPFVISGTEEECATELSDLIDAHGLDEFMISVFDADHGGDLLEATARVLGAR